MYNHNDTPFKLLEISVLLSYALSLLASNTEKAHGSIGITSHGLSIDLKMMDRLITHKMVLHISPFQKYLLMPLYKEGAQDSFP